ncbi:Alpha beta hydrolase [Olea europaea subsp. europaea]|uniref:Alpha beta hydrolase n=1 Tax=Olea europaea subsp. europaea TaxID=158383 RepID=A0A8S0Q495_OLEEU|nr:Alpha beta hydrolase [Olea europaea subsp. europaea]
MMEFEFRILEDARLRAHISQLSNLKLVKTVMDHFDERQREDFHNFSLWYLAEEYALVMGIRCCAFAEGSEYEQLLQRRRLKERRLLYIFRCTWGKNFQKTKRRKEKEITYMIHCFSIAMQVWAYEVLPKVGKHFSKRVDERLPRLLYWSARKQPQHRTYNAFFKNVEFHVYTTLRPTDVKAQQPYFSTLVPRGQGHVGREDSDEEASEGRNSEEQTSGGDEEKDASGSDPDDEDSEDNDESDSDRSSVGEDTRGEDRGASSLARPLRAILVARAGPTTTAAVTRVETEAGISSSLPKDIYGGAAKPCSDEQDIPIDTGNMQHAAHIAPCQDDVNLPMAAAIKEVQGAMEPSNVVEDDDDDAEGCNAVDGDGVVTEVTALRLASSDVGRTGTEGGILKQVGLVTLLWGGIRGSVSLTDKLISFMRIAKRPLIPRILGFVFMALLLWSTVVIPLLPSLIQSWATCSPFIELLSLPAYLVSTFVS